MEISRRTALAAGAAGALGAVFGPAGSRAAAVPPPQPPLPPTGTAKATLQATVALGPPNGKGYRKLVAGPGEPHIVWTDLADGQFPTGPGTPLTSFVQMSDLHVVDDQSPARLEYLDKYADFGAPHDGSYPFESAYRAHESLSTHIVDAMCRAIAKTGTGPVTGLPFSLTLLTGDVIDNCQYNETRWYIDLLDGETVQATSGGSTGVGWDGHVGSNGDAQRYWRPQQPWFRGKHYAAGYPELPVRLNDDGTTTGYYGEARRPFPAHGLGMPWYTAYGNHDGMVQGNLSVHDTWYGTPLEDVSTGDRKVLGFISDPLPALYEDLGLTDVPALVLDVATGNLSKTGVFADPDRRFLSRQEFIHEHFTTTGEPAGHGFSNVSDKAYYAVPSAPGDLFQFIALDTTNLGTGLGDFKKAADGSLDREQYEWLEQQLIAGSSRYEVIVSRTAGRQVVTQPGVVDKLFVIFCHHTIDSMDNTDEERPKGGIDLRNLLLRFPNVIMLVDGHTHTNDIKPYFRPSDSNFEGGFWEITTASHIDWPIQSRIIEVAESDGLLSIYTTMLDLDAPLDHNGRLDTPAHLASLARELAANDLQNPLRDEDGFDRRRGLPRHRNARLMLRTPFELPTRSPRVAAGRTSTGRLELTGISHFDDVYSRQETAAASGSFGQWIAHDGGDLRTLAVEANQDGRLELIGVAQNGSLHRKTQVAPGGQWSRWTTLDGTLASVAMARNADGRLDIYGVNAAGQVFTRRQTVANQHYGAWATLDGSLRTIAAATGADGRVTLVGLDRVGTPLQRTQTTAGGGWSPWSGLTGRLSSLALASNGTGQLELFGCDHGGQVLWRKRTSGIWSGWTALPVWESPSNIGFVVSLTAEANSQGRVNVFAQDEAGKPWRTFRADDGGWWPWIDLTAVMAQRPVPAPDLRGMTQGDAAYHLRTAAPGYFTVGNVQLVLTTDDSKVHRVMSQSPAQGTPAPVGSAINLIVGRKKGPGGFEVPVPEF